MVSYRGQGLRRAAERERGLRLRARHGKIRERAAERGKEKHTTREQMREIPVSYTHLFARSPYRAPIAALAAGAAAALAYLEQGEREKMREEILTALNAAAK